MKKLAAAALILGTLSTGSVWAHEAGEFFIRAGTATVRPTEGSDNVMAQWYFGDAQSKVRPYVGAGINYTTFFNEDFNDTGKAAGLSDLSLKDSWGAAGQVGLDYLINRDWLLNMSVWYMDIDTDVKFKAGGVDQKVSTRLDPWVFMFSAGYRF